MKYSNKLRDKFQSLSKTDKEQFINSLTSEELEALYLFPEFFLFDKQIVDGYDWRYYILLCGRAFGKMIDLETELPTPTGFKKLKDVKEGDQLFDENGNITNVIKLHEIDLKPESYIVTFSDGTTVNACKDHLWLTWDKRSRKEFKRRGDLKYPPKVRTTQEIISSLRTNTSKREINHSIKNCEPLNYPEQNLLVDPYILGCWLGDGSTHTGSIESADQEIVDYVSTKYPIRIKRDKIDSQSSSYAFGELIQYMENGTPHFISEFTRDLREIGVLNNKHIPNIYLHASAEQRLALLQGLLDTDGCCNKNNSVEYCTVLPILAENVKELINSLGITAVIHRNDSFLNGEQHKDRYRINFVTKKQVFKLQRKLKNIKTSNNQDTITTHRRIVSIRPIEPVPMRCITVDSPSHLFLITRSFIPTHNTYAGSGWLYRKILDGAKTVACCAPTYADLLGVMIPALMQWSPPGKKPVYNKVDHTLKYPNGATVWAYSSDTEVRGPNIEYLWCDEIVKWSSSIPEKVKEHFEIMDYAVRAGKTPQTIITTTPKPFPLIKEWKEKSETSNLYKIGTGTMFDNPFLPDSYRQAMLEQYGGTRLGRQEIWGELLVDIEGALWTGDMIENDRISAVKFKDTIRLERVVIGCDPAVTNAEDSDSTGIIVCGYAKGHAYVLADYSIKTSPDKWARQVVRAYEEFGATMIVAEVNQGGDLVTEVIRTVSKNIPIKTIHARKAKLTRAEPISSLYEQHKVHHVGVFKQLEDEMTSYNGDPKRKSPDRMDALVYAISELMIQNVYTNRNFDSVGVY